MWLQFLDVEAIIKTEQKKTIINHQAFSTGYV